MSLPDSTSDIVTACRWEVDARKAGNVHPFAGFEDLTHVDFVQSAVACAPALADSTCTLGMSILSAIRATRSVVSTNTNLGIVLLLAPLARCRPNLWKDDLPTILDGADVADTRHVFEAIRTAVPGGLGRADEQDIADEPTLPLRQVMGLAADHDMIARQYAQAFADLLDIGVPALLNGFAQFNCVEAAILQLQLRLLVAFPDSLIARKRGTDATRQVSDRARGIDLSTAAGRAAYAEFDRWLRRDGHAFNPGTTADLIAACLFIALRERRMTVNFPFAWDLYG